MSAQVELRRGCKYIRAKDAPSYIPMSERYLRKLVTLGLLPAFKVGRRLCCYRYTDLDALMESCRIGKAVTP